MPASSGDQAMKVILFLLGWRSEWAPSVSCGGSYIVPGTLARGKLVLKVVDGVPGALADSALRPVSHCSRAPAAPEAQRKHLPTASPRCSNTRGKLTLLLFVWALTSFSRKTSQSGLSEASSTTICLLSSDSLKMMNLYFLLSFSSLYEDMQSWATIALQGGRGRLAGVGGHRAAGGWPERRSGRGRFGGADDGP